MGKTYVGVIAEYDESGNIKPLSMKWKDSRVFEIDHILDVRQAASLKAGGQGIRYTCRICGKSVYLFCDEGRWFLET